MDRKCCQAPKLMSRAQHTYRWHTNGNIMVEQLSNSKLRFRIECNIIKFFVNNLLEDIREVYPCAE